MEMVLLNPRRRRRKGARSARKSRRRARKMSALQMKYFGKRAAHPVARRRRRRVSRRRSAIPVLANPIRRRRRRSASGLTRARRRYRRNPISLGSLRASTRGIVGTAINAAVGGAGAVGADILMGNVLKVMPDQVVLMAGSRIGADGRPNLAYYGMKLGLMTLLGAGVNMVPRMPGALKRGIARGVEGAYTVSAYEMLRLSLPTGIALGAYANSAQLSRGAGVNPQAARGRLSGAYTRRLSGMGASFPAGSVAPYRAGGSLDARVGEGAIR